VSFAGLSATVIALAAAFLALVGLAQTRFRRQLLGGVIAFYPATLIYSYFPWYAPTTPGAAIGLWAGCFAVSYWALHSRVDSAPWPRLGRFTGSLALAVAAFAELVALHVSVLPLGEYFALPGWLTVISDISMALPVLLAAVWIF
jgi:hypothetical protein